MVLKCYSSWIILGVVPLNTMHSSSVLHLAIRVLTQHTSTQNIHEAASDCVINLLSRFEKEVKSFKSLGFIISKTENLRRFILNNIKKLFREGGIDRK